MPNLYLTHALEKATKGCLKKVLSFFLYSLKILQHYLHLYSWIDSMNSDNTI